MKISYLVTCHNEVTTLYNLLTKICHSLNFHDESKKSVDDEIIILDDYSDDKRTQAIISMGQSSFSKVIKTTQHNLNNDYGAHKNYGNQQCKGDFIFQIDGDEMPPDSLLGENLHNLIESNSDTELYYVPRINDFKGVTEEHAKQWGWTLTPSPLLNGRPKAVWPDLQGRIYKNVPDRIKWENKLHERIVGNKTWAVLPIEEDWAIHHNKTIETQIATNLRYNRDFSEAENKGISNKRA